MGLIGFIIKVAIILAIVIVILSYAWPHIEPYLPLVKNITTGMATAVMSSG